MQASQNGDGISAVLTSLAQPAVESGHVAGWVGVGGPGQGPGGSDEWIQVGLNSLPGTSNKLYYEVMRPGAGATYAEVATNVSNGRPIRVAVLETASYPNAWRVWVDGRPVTPPIELVGSHRALTPMAMGESWDGGRPACNRFSYRFQRVSIAAAPGGSWQPASDAAVLQDPGYRVVKRAPASFDASATRALPTAPPAAPAPAPAATPAPARPAAAQTPQVVTARPVSATVPLRKGFLPTPSLAAILGVTSQPVVTQPVVTQPVAPVPVETALVTVTPAEGTEPAPAETVVEAVNDAGIGAAGSYLTPGEQTQ